MGPVDKPGIRVGKALSGKVIVYGNSNVQVSPEGRIAGRDIKIDKVNKKEILSENQAFERIGAGVKLNLEQLKKNVEQARAESTQFFKLTLIFSSLGFIVVLVGVGLLYFGEITAGLVSSVSGIIPELTAVLFFKKDKELRQTIESYHQHILDSQKVLTMVDVAETVSDCNERDKLKRDIIMHVLNTA